MNRVLLIASKIEDEKFLNSMIRLAYKGHGVRDCGRACSLEEDQEL